MLKTLFGDLGPRPIGAGYAPTEVAFAATAVLEEAAPPAALPREHDPHVVDVFVSGSPAQSIREHFTKSRADLGSATAARVVEALSRQRLNREVTPEEIREVLAAEGIELSKLRVPGLRKPFFGEAPRPLFVRAAAFSISQPEPDELSSRQDKLKRTVRFDLPRGAYATVVLRALGQ